MKNDDDDYEELDEDDDLDDDYDDDDFDDLEEEGDSEASTALGQTSASGSETGEIKTVTDETPSPLIPKEEGPVFDELLDEDEDEDLGFVGTESGGGEAAPAIAEEPVIPETKGTPPALIILPALGLLLGIGFFFMKGEESSVVSPPLAIQEKIETPSGDISPQPKTALDSAIPDDYVELKKMELSDPAKIDSLVSRGLLQKKSDPSGLSTEKLILTLYQTERRYVVSQTYHYSDGTKWTVETHFSDSWNDPQEVIKAFDTVYSG